MTFIMKSLDELICSESRMSVIEEWMLNANKPVNILQPDIKKSKAVLLDLQITVNSILGTVAYLTGGISVDSGWLRILGGGNDAFQRTLSSWNQINMDGKCERYPGTLLVADDVLGGFYAMNGGAFNGKTGDVFYFAPETQKWESLEMPYSSFLQWAITGDLDLFYKSFRWDGWKKEILTMKFDQSLLFYPFLWSEEVNISDRTKKVVPIEELWNLSMQL